MKARTSPRRSPVLSLLEVTPLARTLAQKEAHRPEDIDDLQQVALFAYHKAERRCLAERIPVEKPWAFARTTLQRAMRGYYYQQREWQQRGEPNKAIGIDQVGLSREREYMAERNPMLIVGLDGNLDTGEQAELFELDDYFTALERTCGHTARLMVENLLAPTGECCARILDEVRGKVDQQKRFKRRPARTRRHQPRGVKKEIRISQRIVRDALGISPTEWCRNMERIRDFTQRWLGKSVVTH